MKATAMPLPIPLVIVLKNLTITNPIGKVGIEQLNASRQI
jgi:hypothetical protein